MGWFKRKPKEILPPDQQKWQKHQEALRKFIENQTSMGMYGDSNDLHAAKSALRYFAYLEFPELIRAINIYVEARRTKCIHGHPVAAWMDGLMCHECMINWEKAWEPLVELVDKLGDTDDRNASTD